MKHLNIKKHKNIIEREVDGIIYIVDPETQTIHSLNETATYIWKQLSNSRSVSVDDISQKLCSTYQVSKKQATQDVIELVTKYIDRGLLIES